MVERKNARGAIRYKQKEQDKNRRPLPWRRLLTLCFGVITLGLVSWSIARLEPLAIIEEYANRPINNVSVQGKFRYVSQTHIQSLVAEKLTRTFLELDIIGLKNHIEKNAWVDHAVVKRQWPDTLVIEITEQQPIARWNSSSFLNLRGEIVEIDNKIQLNHLPLLKADNRYAERVMKHYVLMAKLLPNYQFAPLVLELDNTLSWTLTMTGNLKVRLGRNEALDKLKRLLHVLTVELSGRIDQIATIDMRYEQGFAVEWLPQAQ